MATIRTLAPTEWKILKDLRIRSITDAPDAFEPLDPDLAESEAFWQETTGSLVSPDGDVLVAEENNREIGMVFVRIDNKRVGHVGAMWVDPEARGSGLGKRLLDDSICWHLKRRVTTIRLWVTDGNLAATSLYEDSGFVRTGNCRPLRDGESLRIVEMERSFN